MMTRKEKHQKYQKEIKKLKGKLIRVNYDQQKEFRDIVGKIISIRKNSFVLCYGELKDQDIKSIGYRQINNIEKL